MKTSKLLVLASKIEESNCGSETLDASLADVFDPPETLYAGPPPPYTKSIDNAATLARKAGGFIVTMGDIVADGLPGACICISTDPVREVWGVSTGGGAENEMLARALCAAALRAFAYGKE